MPTIQGKIIRTFEQRSGQNDRGSWMAQDFLLESYDQPYPRRCLFSVWGADRLQQFNIKEGDDLAVDVDLDAREFNGRYYNSVRAWRVVRITPPQPQTDVAAGGQVGIGQPLPPSAPVAGAALAASAAVVAVPPPTDPLMAGGETEDLPF